VYGTRDTGLNAVSFGTVAALHGEGQRSFLLYQHSWQSPWHFLLESFDDLLGARVLYQTMDLAQPAGDAVFLVHIDALHEGSPTWFVERGA
jgi:hypothetical protein